MRETNITKIRGEIIMGNTIEQSPRIDQKQLEQLQLQRQGGLKSSEYLNQNGLNKAMTQEQAAKISVFLPGQMAALNYGLEKQEIQQSDYDKAIKGEQMSADGQTAFAALKERLSANFAKLLEFFSSNKETGEKGEALNDKEQAEFDAIMADGIVTDEELAKYEEEIEKFEEEKQAEEAKKAEEEAKKDEAPKPAEAPKAESGDRDKEVIDATNAFFDDLDNGKEFNAKNHPGISEGDYNRILKDYEDDGIIGNGAAKAQFESNPISDNAAKRAKESEKANIDEDKKVKGVWDNNDNKMKYEKKKKGSGNIAIVS